MAPALRSPVAQTFLPLRKPAPELLPLQLQGTGTEFRSSPLPVPRHSTLHLMATQLPQEQAADSAAQAEQPLPPCEQQPPQPTAPPLANVRRLLDSAEKPAADAGTLFLSILVTHVGHLEGGSIFRLSKQWIQAMSMSTFLPPNKSMLLLPGSE